MTTGPIRDTDYTLTGAPYFSTPMMYRANCLHDDYTTGKRGSPRSAEASYADHWKTKHAPATPATITHSAPARTRPAPPPPATPPNSHAPARTPAPPPPRRTPAPPPAPH